MPTGVAHKVSADVEGSELNFKATVDPTLAFLCLYFYHNGLLRLRRFNWKFKCRKFGPTLTTLNRSEQAQKAFQCEGPPDQTPRCFFQAKASELWDLCGS